MIQRKKKTCKGCGESQFLFSHGLCLSCWKSENPFKPKKTNIEKKPYKISPISKIQAKRFAKYLELRDTYLKQHSQCEAKLSGCRLRANQIHHKQGRDGENLFKHFLAVCDNCHHIIEMNPKMAKEMNFSESRIKSENNEN